MFGSRSVIGLGRSEYTKVCVRVSKRGSASVSAMWAAMASPFGAGALLSVAALLLGEDC